MRARPGWIAAAAFGTAVLAAAPALAAAGSAPPNGAYYLAHTTTGGNEFTGSVTLHGDSVSAIGITTNLLACVRPPSTAVQYPGPPDNWQPQKTVALSRAGGNLVLSYSGSFRDRLAGYPQSMQLHATITPAGTVTGKVALQEDDNTASTGEIKCHTEGFISFTGTHG